MYKYLLGILLSFSLYTYCVFNLGQESVDLPPVVCQVVDWRYDTPQFTVLVECQKYFKAWYELAYPDS